MHTDLLDPEANHGVRTDVSFVGDNALVTYAPYIDLASRSQPLRICVWDAASGHLIQMIEDPDYPPDGEVSASADGRTIFAFTGNTDHSDRYRWPTRDPRFTLWNRYTGKRIAVSPRLQLTHVTCGFITIGACKEHDEIPLLHMDADGNAVIVYSYPGIGIVHRLPVRVLALR